MSDHNSPEEIMDFAIKEEEGANQFYLELAGKMENPVMKKVFEDFAAEERNHKAKLEQIKASGLLPPQKRVIDLKIADFAVDILPDPNMDYKDALTLAMRKEKAAYQLYTELSEIYEGDERGDTFAFLAQEEATHKLKFEIEFEDEVLKED
jgi:rubrerythrin